MAGFGASLRMARRSGWERAYLDYEALKLLLSQIEAVYEEEGHRRRQEDDESQSAIHRKAADYRDELFIESDSDLAFASSDEFNEAMFLLQSSDEEQASQIVVSQSTKPFLSTYSQEVSSSDGDSIELDPRCGRGNLVSLGCKGKVPTSKMGDKKKRRDLITFPSNAESEYFGGAHAAKDPSNFIMTNYDGVSTSLLQRDFSNESTALLQHHGNEPANISTLYPGTPPREFNPANTQSWMTTGEGAKFNQAQSHPPTKKETTQQRLRNERRFQRRKRRERLARKQMQREKKVPPHLRLAHTKSRAITERFLGLLRAEVEKVTLFAQARLGELADTAGSLRFQSYEDGEMGGNVSSWARGDPRATSFENPLSNGGMYPSASSSENEDGNRGRQRIFNWSDASDNDSCSQDASRPGKRSPAFLSPIAKSNSGGTISATTEQLSNVTFSNKIPRQKKGSKQNYRRQNEASFNEAVKRQIAHFSDLRLRQPLFQRIDHIVGEDLLLLSAVDEADGYIAVGVELMHVLRFISVNVIAIRKICRRHDRLLMNRMLGGYYHRKRHQNQAEADKEKNGFGKQGATNTFTLGGIVSRSLGDSNARQVFVTGINQNKLTGLYDKKIQQLANSNTVQVISSSIALALSEYEVSHSRADALAKLNSSAAARKTPRRAGGRSTEVMCDTFGISPSRWVRNERRVQETNSMALTFDSDLSDHSNGEDGPPSTSSAISLTRLRFTVVSIFALREVARLKQDNYKAFISRSSLVFTGANVIGEGLDGCSRDILDFFVSYNPDAALLLDASSLHAGLQKDKWKERPIGTVMLSTLAKGVSSTATNSDGPERGADIVTAVSVMPISGDLTYLDGKHKMKKKLFMSNIPDLLGQGINPAILRLNSMGRFFFSINYYIVHSTATAFVQEVGVHTVYSAFIIGATSFGALVSAVFQLRSMSHESYSNEANELTMGYFRRAFLLCSIFPIVGNIVHAVGVSRGSILLAISGRFIVGLGSAELLHRQLLSSCLPAPHVVFESANLVHFHLFGIFCGLVIGGFLARFDVHVQVTTISSLHSGSYFMACLWLFHMASLLVKFQETYQAEREGKDMQDGTAEPKQCNEIGSLESSESSELDCGTPESVFCGSVSISTADDAKATYVDELKATYESRLPQETIPALSRFPTTDQKQSERSLLKIDDHKTSVKKKRDFHCLRTSRTALRRILSHDVSIPVTLFVIVFVRISHEILFSSCAMVTNRYFKWNGSQACFLLGLLTAAVLPINYVVERISRSYDERTVIKRSIIIAGIGFLIMFNYVSFINLMIHIRSIFVKTTEKAYHPYDWIFGTVQYLCGLLISFVGITSLEPCVLSLMSKSLPSKSKSIAVNGGSILTILSLTARVLGDMHILIVGLSHRLINTDILNSLVMPLLLACLVAGYVVQRNFFFLI